MSTETSYTATFDRSSQLWIWDKEYEYGPQPGSPVDALSQKIKNKELLTHDDFFTYLFMMKSIDSSYVENVVCWILNQGDITADSRLSFAAWKGLYYAYEHEHNKVEWVTQKEHEIVKSMRNAWTPK